MKVNLSHIIKPDKKGSKKKRERVLGEGLGEGRKGKRKREKIETRHKLSGCVN